MLGEVEPDQGTVKYGTNLEVAVFDQSRAQLVPDRSLWDNLTSDPEMAVSGKSDQIMVRGQPKHVVGYLKEFLFDEAQVRAPVRVVLYINSPSLQQSAAAYSRSHGRHDARPFVDEVCINPDDTAALVLKFLVGRLVRVVLVRPERGGEHAARSCDSVLNDANLRFR